MCPAVYKSKMEKTIYTKEYALLIGWLKKKRKEQKLSMRDVAEKAGVIHSWIGKIEQAERRLDIIEYATYCRILGIDPHEGLNLINKS
jgi:transcriptional regulator with XRE-family HTH domain